MNARNPVFAGPSLWGCSLPGPTFILRPPAIAGDLIALLADPPKRVCLIDGLFDACAAPWHKEILLLMAAGTRVYGAASMGALRAAELDRFGMIGVGTVYAAYRKGLLTGDDEVALAHGPEDWSWRPLSIPMVEVRASLINAYRHGLLSVEEARAVRSAAHCIHYAERDWPAIIAEAHGLADEHALLRLAETHVRLKQRDALACLECCATDLSSSSESPAPPVTVFTRRLASSRRVEAHLPPPPPV